MPETDYLFSQRAEQRSSMIGYLNAFTVSALNEYPEVETRSWETQRIEAEKVVNAGDNATLAMAPLLTRVSFYQFGSSDNPSRLQQVKEKAALVHQKASFYMEIVAFVNGLRARTDDALAASTSIGEILDIMNSMRLEAQEFRGQAGF